MESPPKQDRLETGNPFCNNPLCDLHVRAGDPGVCGFGNWAVLENGLTVGRGLYGGVFLCDRCGQRTLR
jgi:hypothetical protein